MDSRHEKRIKAYQEVIADIKEGVYTNTIGCDVEFPHEDEMFDNAKMFKRIHPVSEDIRMEFPETKIYAQNIDVLEKAAEFGRSGVLLNMASEVNPGGGVAKGSMAEEEEICRRTNLLLSLYSYSPNHASIFESYADPLEGTYPLELYGGIWTPDVCIYRDKNYKVIEPTMTNVVSVAALRNPPLTKDGKIIDKLVPVMKGKIRTILRIAMQGRKSKLVLSAFGCGAFHCPAPHVAELFKEVLEEPEFVHAFEEICFAILDDANARGVEGNYKPFERVFGKYDN